MKTLILVRHAKSGKKTRKLRDLERPLNKRGLKDAVFIGKILKKHFFLPDQVISSPAHRAMQTASLMSQELELSKGNIISDAALYMESKTNLLNTIRQLDNQFHVVCIVSHNPGLEDLVNYLSVEAIDSIPTGGTIAMQFDAQRWDELDSGFGKILFFESPKKMRKEAEKSEKSENHVI